MAVVELLARLKADTKQFTTAMDQAAKATGRVETSANKTSSFLGGKFKLGVFAAATALTTFAIKLGKDSVQAANVAGAAQQRLRKLLLNTNGATEEGIQLLFQQGKALEALTGISAQNITVVQSQLATFDLHGSTIAKLTPAILDYVVAEKGASASADEFRSMTNGLAQALNGQFGSLTKTGFVLDAQTKKMIKSGTESERAAAIVSVLGTTYRNFAAEAGGPAAVAQRKFLLAINDTKEALGQGLKPVITNVTNALSTTLSPVVTKLQAIFSDGTSIQKFANFIFGLLGNIKTFAQAIATVFAPIFTGLLVPAFKLAIGATIGFIKVLGAIGGFIQRNAALFQVFIGAIIALGIAVGAYIVQVKVFNAVHKIMLALSGAQAIATAKLTKVFKGLNMVMRMNPIGLIVSAVALLAAGFMLLWNRSEAFRKIMIAVGKAGLKVAGFLIRAFGVFAEGLANIITGPAKILFKLLSFISPQAKEAYEGLKNMTNGIGNFFDNAASAVEGFSDNLDGLNKKKVKGPKVETTVAGMPDLSGLGTSNKAAAKTEKELRAAQKAYQDALDARESAMKKFGELLRQPFGQPSAIAKALSGAEATVDSIISTYDELVEAVKERFTGLDPRGKSQIIDFLQNQTKLLVGLASKRELAVEAFKKSEEDLKELLEEQATFQRDLSKGIKDFAKALITLSDADTNAVLKVTKTGSGLVISQVRKATKGVDSIVKQLTDRLTQVVNFGKNIEKLLAAGLSKEYIQQLLEAGPEAASETAQLLTTASAEQIKQINSLYSQINTQATKFGSDMSTVFYGNAVAIAQAFVAGSKAEVDSITAQMTAIKDDIESVLKPLAEFGGQVGTDMAMNLVKALEAKRALLVSTAKSIADDINNALDLCDPIPKDTKPSGPSGGGDGPTVGTPFGQAGSEGGKKPPKPTIDNRFKPTDPSGGKTKIDPKLMPTFGNIYGPPITSPIIRAAKPVTPPPQIGTPAQRTAFASTQSLNLYGSPVMNARPPVTVNISTPKVVPTVTATTIANAVNKAVNTRSR